MARRTSIMNSLRETEDEAAAGDTAAAPAETPAPTADAAPATDAAPAKTPRKRAAAKKPAAKPAKSAAPAAAPAAEEDSSAEPAKATPPEVLAVSTTDAKRLGLYLHPDDFKALGLAKVEDGADANARIRAMIALWRANPRVRGQIDRLAKTARKGH